MELNNIEKSKKLLPEDPEAATAAPTEGASASPPSSQPTEEVEPSTTSSRPRRVSSVKIAAGGAIDRIEFRYEDGSKWSLGGPGGDKGIPPLVLAEDEYLEEVRHESLPQWWYVGSAIEFRTNKGKLFRHVAGWGSGEDEWGFRGPTTVAFYGPQQ